MALSFLFVCAALLLPESAFADGGMPTYLFVDWRYWLFIILYLLITIQLVRFVRRMADRRDAKNLLQ